MGALSDGAHGLERALRAARPEAYSGNTECTGVCQIPPSAISASAFRSGFEVLPDQLPTNDIVAAAVIEVAAIPPPSGWDYLWFVRSAEIYRPCSEPERPPAICCHTHNDVGRLQKDLLLALKPGTRLLWAWRMDRLPSRGARIPGQPAIIGALPWSSTTARTPGRHSCRIRHGCNAAVISEYTMQYALEGRNPNRPRAAESWRRRLAVVDGGRGSQWSVGVPAVGTAAHAGCLFGERRISITPTPPSRDLYD